MSLKSAAKKLFLKVCILAWLFLLPSFAGAQDVFSAFIILNEQPIENPVWVEYYSDDESKSLVHTVEITSYLKEIFSEKVYEKIEKKLDDEGRITFKSLNDIDIKTQMDLNSLNLALTVNVEDKKLTEVFISNRRRKKDIVDLYQTEPVSGYLNFRSAVEFLGTTSGSSGVNTYDRTSLLQFEPVLNFFGLVLESQYNYTDNQLKDEHELNRIFTRAVYDDQKRSTRYTLGDLTESSRGFQTIGFGIGFNFRKEFAITPNLFRSSFKRHKFFLEADSKVEIFVNGRLVKKLYLKQGPVEMSDFPFTSGENEVRLRVTDAIGNIRIINYSDINDSRILPKGFKDYSFSVLFPRRDNLNLGLKLGEESYDYDDYNLNGYFHYGAFTDGTLGVDWQYSRTRYLFGLETIYGREEGLLKFNAAASESSTLNLSGFAARLEYENLLFRDGRLTDFSFLSGLEYRDEGFTTLESEGPENTKFIGTVSVGQNLKNSIRGSLGFAKEWGYDSTGDRSFLTSNFGWTVFKSLDFSANIRYNLVDSEDSTILLAINWYSKSNNQQFTSTYDPINKSVNSEYVSFPVENSQNFRTFVGGEVAESSKRAAIGLDYFNQRAEYKLAHSSAFISNGGQVQSTQLGFSTGVAFTTKGIAITKPVDDAFVLVSMPDRPRGHSVPIGKGVDSQRGEINRFGPASVTNLAPYFNDRINLDIASLPYGYTLKNEVFSFFPTYRGGVHIKVGVEGEVSINGRAIFEDGAPAAYVTGNVFTYSADAGRGEVMGQFFTGGSGEFSVESLEKGTYVLVFEGSEGEYREVIVPIDKAIGVHELKSVIRLVLK